MLPALVETEPFSGPSKAETKTSPLKSSGSLDGFKQINLTPVIGTEFVDVNIVDDIINATNSEERIRDLAIKISENGVVFFRKQANLTNDLQKKLVLLLGKLTCRPDNNSLHIHPVLNDNRELGGTDSEISTISSAQRKNLYRNSEYTRMAAVWHSDIQFEVQPADYSSLKLTQLPKTGGDTLWASGYEIYDRISKPYQKFLETLTASCVGVTFHDMVANEGFELYTDPRGSPLNVGNFLSATHPVVRTNPVTGWKSIFPVGSFPVAIDGLSKVESRKMLEWFHDMITYGHDLQVRFKWMDENDIAIWDNRSTFHTATGDYAGLGDRFGVRAVGVGETPYFDPNSKSRREELGTMGDLSIVHK